MKLILTVFIVLLSFNVLAQDAAKTEFDKVCADKPTSTECVELGTKAFAKKDCYKVKLNLAKACEGNIASACHMAGLCGIFSDKSSEEYKTAKAQLTKACDTLKFKFACDDVKKFVK